jgi:hypothetical protein
MNLYGAVVPRVQEVLPTDYGNAPVRSEAYSGSIQDPFANDPAALVYQPYFSNTMSSGHGVPLLPPPIYFSDDLAGRMGQETIANFGAMVSGDMAYNVSDDPAGIPLIGGMNYIDDDLAAMLYSEQGNFF